MPSLRVTAGNASGSEIPLEQEFAIGRSANGLGKLGDDPELSRTHARVSRDASGQVFIEDLGSTNGTFVNEQRITGARPLSPGDRIRVGHTSMTLEADAPAPPPPPLRPSRPHRHRHRRPRRRPSGSQRHHPRPRRPAPATRRRAGRSSAAY